MRPDAAGTLSRRRLMGDLRKEIGAGREHLEELKRRVGELESDRTSKSALAAERAEMLTSGQRDLVTLRVRLDAAVEEEERSASRVDALGHERTITRGEVSSLSGELEGLDLRKLEAARSECEKEIEEAQDQMGALRASAAEASEATGSLKSILSASRSSATTPTSLSS